MSTPKTDLIDESTNPAGSDLDTREELVRSPDGAIADAQGQLRGAEVIMRPPARPSDIRALGVGIEEAIIPVPNKSRGVRSKTLPVRLIQSMTRAARILYRGVL